VLENLARHLESAHPRAARSLRERLEQTPCRDAFDLRESL
jgi:hypothetical protein